MALLSGGDGPGAQGGRVKGIDVLFETRSGALAKETRDRPFSIAVVARWEDFVQWAGVVPRRKESIVSRLLKGKGGEIEGFRSREKGRRRVQCET